MLLVEKPLGLKIAAGLFALMGLLTLVGAVMGFVSVSTNPQFASQLAGLPEQQNAGEGALAASLNSMQESMKTLLLFTLIFVAALSIASIATAFFLWKESRMARYAATVLAVAFILSFSVHTILSLVALYFLWVDNETKKVFSQQATKSAKH